jgi:hypothetical protein
MAMRSFYRIAIMVVVSLLTLTLCGGGFRDLKTFYFIGVFVVVVGGLPIIALVTTLHFAERAFGGYALILITLIGFIPLALLVSFGGDDSYAKVPILSGWGWSAAWVATSLLFPKETRRQITKASSDAP